MPTQKVQHELSPEMERKITGLAKKAIKIYLIIGAICLGIFMVACIVWYFFWVKPIYQGYQKNLEEHIKRQEQIEQSRLEFEQKREALEKELEEGNKEFQKTFEEAGERIKETEEKIKSVEPTFFPE